MSIEHGPIVVYSSTYMYSKVVNEVQYVRCEVINKVICGCSLVPFGRNLRSFPRDASGAFLTITVQSQYNFIYPQQQQQQAQDRASGRLLLEDNDE